MKRETDHFSRFLHMAREYGRSIGFNGYYLIEPKPMEPMKHQYDFDSGTAVGFLKMHGLAEDFKLNIEANHATLAGHTFEHDLQVASDHGMPAALMPTAVIRKMVGIPINSRPICMIRSPRCWWCCARAGLWAG